MHDMGNSGTIEKAWLGLGSNLGNRKRQIEQAIELMEYAGIRVSRKSALYESDAVGFQSANRFINLCLDVETFLDPPGLLSEVKKIEKQLGREKRPGGYTDRPIDIDILFYGDSVFQSKDLIIPHPGIPDRLFVLMPLAEIAPDKMHPELHTTIKDLLEQCADTTTVERV